MRRHNHRAVRDEHDQGRPAGHHHLRRGGPPPDDREPDDNRRRDDEAPRSPFGEPRPHRPGPPRGGRRGRAPRGDVRIAVLQLLAEEPMHGYQLMQAIAERSGRRWTPSPGAIYPTINQLEDEGLVVVTADAGRRLVTLTDLGRQHVDQGREKWADPFADDGARGPGADLRGLLEQLHDATRQIGRSGTDEQRGAAAEVLTKARRALYLLLADEPADG